MYVGSTWRAARAAMVFSYNIIVAFLSVVAAYFLRIDQEQFVIYQNDIVWSGILFSAITSLMLIQFKVYSGFWRRSSIVDLEKFLQATLFAFAVYVVASVMSKSNYGLSWSILCVQLLLFLCLSLCPRIGLRFVYEKYKSWVVWRAHRGKVCRVLLVGAGEGATMLLRAFKEIESGGYYAAVGILDLKRHNVGRQILGAPILGSLENFDIVMQQLESEGRKPNKIVLTTPLFGQKLLDLQIRAERFNVRIFRTPSLTDFQPTSERGGIDLRPVAVEDLLERPEIKLQENSIEGLIEGRCVLVTGAGGSIGSELCRQIARRAPGSLILVDASEYNLYAISMNIREQFPHLSMVAQLADIRNAPRIQEIFDRHCPELVFHAAALKHVPLCEDNPCESAHTNIIGTRNVAEAALASGALAFVQISTDKAVNPTSVMGATKRMAELYCQSLDIGHADKRQAVVGGVQKPRFITVRFGNVLGSSGSVVPLFQKQLQQGGPLTVTHPEMTRFFMSIREAAELVLQGSARALSDGANRGQILVLDMGEPVNILDFAERLTRLAGLQPYKDIPIEFIGLRPGEKLREELFDEAEGRLDSGVAGILAAKPNPIQLSTLRSLVQSLERMCSQGNDEAVLRLLKESVPGYQPCRPVAPVRTLVQARKTELIIAQPALAEGTSA
jgi:FlaA1/EpsC-like NDP-sugar epimerase